MEDDSLEAVDEAIVEQVQRELDDLPRAMARQIAKQVKPPYDYGSPEMVRVLARQMRLDEQVRKALDALSDDVRYLVEQQVQPPYSYSSYEQVRKLAEQFRGSMG
jgi:hypothetical protein